MRNRLLLFAFIILGFSTLASQLLSEPVFPHLSKQEQGTKPYPASDAATEAAALAATTTPSARPDTLAWSTISTSAQQSAPSPLAAASNVVCGGVEYTFINEGPPHFKYEWYVNDVLVSTARNLVYTFNHNTSYEVVLRGRYENELLYSSAKFRTPLGPFDSPLKLSFTKPPGCKTAGTYEIHIKDSGANDYSTTYELWKDGEKMDPRVVSDGNIFFFMFSADLQENTTYEVRGYRTTSCGDYFVSQEITIEVDPKPILTLDIEAVGGIHCYEDREYAFIIKNSQIGVEYAIESVKFYQGNGGDLLIPYDYYSPRPFPPGYRRELKVGAKMIDCWQAYEMEQKAVIEVSPLSLNAEASATIISLNQPYNVVNSSVADSYRWEVIDGDKKQVYTTAALPALRFSTTGDKQIVLHGYSNTGCSASMTFHVKVTQPFSDQRTLASCFDQSIVYKGPDDVLHNKTVLASKTDKNGFLYQTGYVWATNPSGNYAYTFFVEKFDPSGKQAWHRRSPNSYYLSYIRTFGSSLALDDEGNVYVAGSFDDREMQIDDVVLHNHPSAHRAVAGFVIKFNSTGKAEWGIATQEETQNSNFISLVTDIAITKRGELYFTVFSEERSLAIFADKKKVSLASTNGHNLVSLVKINKDGHYLASEPLMQAGTSGTTSLSYQNVELVLGIWTHTPIGPKLAVDAAGNILISGAVSINPYFGGQGYMTVGQTRLTPDAGTRQAGYITRYSPSTGWGKTFISYESPESVTPAYSSYSMPARNKIISAPDGFYTLFNWSKDDAHDGDGRRLITVGDQVYASSAAGSCLSKYDPEGNLLWSNFSDATFISDLVLQPESNSVLLYGTAEHMSAFTSAQHKRSYGLVASNTRNHFLQATLANGDLAWVWQDHTATERLEAQTVSLAGNRGVYLTYKSLGDVDSRSINPVTVSPETQLRYLPLAASCSPAAVTVPFTRTRICLGGEVQLGIAGGNGSYSWEPATGLNNPSIANPVASPSATTLYKVTTQTAAGEAVVREILVEVSAPFEQEPDFTATVDETGLVVLEMLFDHPDFTFEWSFSDGQKDSRRKHILGYYTEETSLAICLTVKNGCEEKTVCKTVELPCKKSPRATINHFVEGTAHTFSLGYQQHVTSWKWVFSDGFESTEETVNRTLPYGRNYSVQLLLFGDCDSEIVTEHFKTPCPPLRAGIKYTVSGRTVSLFAEGVPEEHIESWLLHHKLSSDKKPVYTLPYNGTFTAYLKLNDGCSIQTMVVDITIDCHSPAADFTFSGTGLSFRFSPSAVIDENANLLWDFGDGSQSSERSPTHTYAAAGFYLVTLKTTDNCGPISIMKSVAPQQIITGIIKDEHSILLKLQPVPANDYLQIALGEELLPSVSHVIVYNAQGQVVLTWKSRLQVKNQLDTRTFRSGAYHLKVVRKDGHYLLKRFIVQH